MSSSVLLAPSQSQACPVHMSMPVRHNMPLLSPCPVVQVLINPFICSSQVNPGGISLHCPFESFFETVPRHMSPFSMSFSDLRSSADASLPSRVVSDGALP